MRINCTLFLHASLSLRWTLHLLWPHVCLFTFCSLARHFEKLRDCESWTINEIQSILSSTWRKVVNVFDLIFLLFDDWQLFQSLQTQLNVFTWKNYQQQFISHFFYHIFVSIAIYNWLVQKYSMFNRFFHVNCYTSSSSDFRVADITFIAIYFIFI